MFGLQLTKHKSQTGLKQKVIYTLYVKQQIIYLISRTRECTLEVLSYASARKIEQNEKQQNQQFGDQHSHFDKYMCQQNLGISVLKQNTKILIFTHCTNKIKIHATLVQTTNNHVIYACPSKIYFLERTLDFGAVKWFAISDLNFHSI